MLTIGKVNYYYAHIDNICSVITMIEFFTTIHCQKQARLAQRSSTIGANRFPVRFQAASLGLNSTPLQLLPLKKWQGCSICN